jgi:anti-anti-sigma factor
MADLTFIDSANLGVLAMAHNDLAAQGSRLTVTNAPPVAMMVFRLSGLDQMLIVRPGPGGQSAP